MKKFIFTVPLQPEGKLEPMNYVAVDNRKLASEEKTMFPVMHLISNYATKGEMIKVIPIYIGNPAVEYNYKLFHSELDALKERTGFEYSINIVEKNDNETIETILSLFVDLIGNVDDGDTLFACLTYGTKVVPIVINMMLNYAYKCKKGVSVEAVVYGLKDFSDKTGKRGELYDITSLFYMDSVVNKLAEMKASDPEGAIRQMLGM